MIKRIKIKNIHLIGIGGIGMSGIAELLQRHGLTVTGSDTSKGESVRKLAALGVHVFDSHQASNVEKAELVVHSSAIRADNPELVAANAKEIPVIPRAEMLAELMRMQMGIAVAGAHGKTTTSSLIALALVQGGLDPTIVVGGRMDNFGGTNARLGAGEFMVVEADESDGSFNKLSPCIAVVTNMDREHMDHYGNMAQLRKAFLQFLQKVPFYGLSVVCGDDPQLRLLLPRISRRKKTYGFSKDCAYQITSYEAGPSGTESRVHVGTDQMTLKLQLSGKHNALNALAALVVSDEVGISRKITLEALAAFHGVQRRFQKKGEIRGVQFIDDYAHHPSEIRATLAAARERFPHSKLRVVFQPHRYSRVEDLFDQFSECFRDCDAVAVTDIYAAGENPIPGVGSDVLAQNIARSGVAQVQHFSKPIEGIERWLFESQPGDVILTLGAGDLPNVYKQLF